MYHQYTNHQMNNKILLGLLMEDLIVPIVAQTNVDNRALILFLIGKLINQHQKDMIQVMVKIGREENFQEFIEIN